MQYNTVLLLRAGQYATDSDFPCAKVTFFLITSLRALTWTCQGSQTYMQAHGQLLSSIMDFRLFLSHAGARNQTIVAVPK